MNRHGGRLSLLLLSTSVIIGLANPAQAEEPGALTLVVKDQISDRPIRDAQITLTPREGNARRSVATDAEGRVVVTGLEPGLYAVEVVKSGFTSSQEPSIRVVTRRNIRIDFELEDSDIEEIVVRARRADRFASASSTYRDRDALRDAVGGGSDPFFSLDGLPGLASTGEFASFSVRGRGPRDNLIFVDDIPFDKAVHFDASLGEDEDIGGGGRFSIFAPNVISGAEFSPGGWGAAYGGRAASLLKLEVAGGSPSPSASLRLDLAGLEVGYDGPAYLTEGSTLLFSARQLDFGRLFKTIDEGDIGDPELRDVILKSVVPVNEDHSIEVLLIDTHETYTRGVDNVAASPNFEDVSLQDSRQDSDLYGVTLRSLIGENSVLTNRIYYRRSDKVSSEGEAFPDLVAAGSPASSFPVREDIITINEDEREIGWRSDFQTENRFGVFSAGLLLTQIELDFDTVLNGNWNRFVYDSDDFRANPNQRFIVLTPQRLNASLDRSEVSGAAYVDQVFDLGDWDLRTGVRFERDGFASQSTVSPRFSVNWRPNATVRYFATAGIFHQSPRYLDLATNRANRLKTEEVTHGSIGVEYRPIENWSLLAEAYYQKQDKLVVDLDRSSKTFANIGDGKSYGLDLVANGTIGKGLFATATYSYNDAKIDRRDGRGDVAAEFSRKHVGTLGLTWEISDHWKIAGRYKYLSGRPADAFIIHPNVLGPGQPLRFSQEITARNVGRNGASGLLNARIDYRQAVGPIEVTAFLDVINVTGASSSDDVEFDYRRGVVVRDKNSAEPLIGLRFDYAW